MVWRYSRDYLKHVHRILELGYPAPTPTETRFCLAKASSEPSVSGSITYILSVEVQPDNPTNGYTRQIRGQRITAVDLVGDLLTIPEHRRTEGQEIYFSSTVSLPGPLLPATPYVVRNPTANTLQVAPSGGAVLDLTTIGSGTNIMKMGSVFDTGVDNREESIFDEIRFVAAGTDIVFQGVFALLNSGSGPSSVPVSAINVTTETLTTAASHGMNTGEPVIITIDSGGTTPGGLSSNVLYYVRVISTTTFTLHTTSADAIANTAIANITSAGSGVRLRNGRGIIIGWDWYAAPLTIPSGQTQRIEIPSNILNAGSLAGV